MITRVSFHLSDLLGLIGVEPDQMKNERFACSVLAALYANQWFNPEPGHWQYIGMGVPACALGFAADAIPHFDDVNDDEYWRKA